MSEGSSDLSHRITLRGASFGERSYTFTVTGAVEAADDTSIEAADTIDGQTVLGGVTQGDVDTYWFSGRLTFIAGGGHLEAAIEYGDESSSDDTGCSG